MTIYHVPFETDAEAAAALATDALQARVAAVGGTIYLSRSFGQGPAYLVLSLPADASLADDFHPLVANAKKVYPILETTPASELPETTQE